ncbi:uncharacterized protein SCHCODRAFT_02574303 [Schizophyllum commune H4-8]|uniref:Uncharacterized protein n=1 Tax=Schizophyllum commune (strain H4-8 / FGSC 9210) TaxID=578458 RepID=D8PNC3_SCHCM|nr:uncharacterized protein SCHCODRAFT_02574303 [Schizophyllum commune H4-8]KAI5893146.1 hypothetical protein SCHCODRAFT_02574303 [Schizophyllum commune H4-8]
MSAPPITASVDVEILGGRTFPKGDLRMLPPFAEFVQSTLRMPLSSLPPLSEAQQPRPPLTPPTPPIRPLREIIYPDCAHRGPIKLTEAADLAQFKSPKTSPSRTMSLKGADVQEILHLYRLKAQDIAGAPFAVRKHVQCHAITPTGICNRVHTVYEFRAMHMSAGQATCPWQGCGHRLPVELLRSCYAEYIIFSHIATAHYGGTPTCKFCLFPLYAPPGTLHGVALANHLSLGRCLGLARFALMKGLPVPLPEEKDAGREPTSHLERTSAQYLPLLVDSPSREPTEISKGASQIIDGRPWDIHLADKP